ncbi:hypothetical protein [Prevotella amnii]|uniref:hypothetical protein n=1 Tax=Prevotella amnii TaxID=419005 RepID=UPI000A6BB58D|nr:hypothetical protein [Prevotella amnii]
MIKFLNPYETFIPQNNARHVCGRIEVCRTIKAQYYKVGKANFIRKDGLGATAVIEVEL